MSNSKTNKHLCIIFFMIKRWILPNFLNLEMLNKDILRCSAHVHLGMSALYTGWSKSLHCIHTLACTPLYTHTCHCVHSELDKGSCPHIVLLHQSRLLYSRFCMSCCPVHRQAQPASHCIHTNSNKNMKWIMWRFQSHLVLKLDFCSNYAYS